MFPNFSTSVFMVLKHLEVSMPIETGQAGVLTLHDYISWLVVTNLSTFLEDGSSFSVNKKF